MLALGLGFLCGLAEFYFLRRFVNAILNQQVSSAMGYLAAKLLLLFALLLTCALLWRDQLAYAGIGVAVPLVLGSVIVFVVQQRKQRKQRDTDAD